jgi:hypothetical protein
MQNGKRVDGTINVMIDGMVGITTEGIGEMTNAMDEDLGNGQGRGIEIEIGEAIGIGIEGEDSMDTKWTLKCSILPLYDAKTTIQYS